MTYVRLCAPVGACPVAAAYLRARQRMVGLTSSTPPGRKENSLQGELHLHRELLQVKQKPPQIRMTAAQQLCVGVLPAGARRIRAGVHALG
ncbi:mucin TcMUCIII [Trypanosoma cruzi cruzi]|nr:mucin TcMUCIII [Trypanosoma cruzi cruzi]